ncbi:hypothetical protein FRC12_023082 [Ceratobasidium sp. 428]|nr:hypothetical protein FRC12_023082 [Ceratobasidium sp. 428]
MSSQVVKDFIHDPLDDFYLYCSVCCDLLGNPKKVDLKGTQLHLRSLSRQKRLAKRRTEERKRNMSSEQIKCAEPSLALYKDSYPSSVPITPQYGPNSSEEKHSPSVKQSTPVGDRFAASQDWEHTGSDSESVSETSDSDSTLDSAPAGGSEGSSPQIQNTPPTAGQSRRRTQANHTGHVLVPGTQTTSGDSQLGSSPVTSHSNAAEGSSSPPLHHHSSTNVTQSSLSDFIPENPPQAGQGVSQPSAESKQTDWAGKLCIHLKHFASIQHLFCNGNPRDSPPVSITWVLASFGTRRAIRLIGLSLSLVANHCD